MSVEIPSSQVVYDTLEVLKIESAIVIAAYGIYLTTDQIIVCDKEPFENGTDGLAYDFDVDIVTGGFVSPEMSGNQIQYAGLDADLEFATLIEESGLQI